MSDETSSKDSLGQLALVLRNERERRGLSIEDFSRLVNISASHIERFENGEFSFLPPLYVFAYLRKYASEVGVADDSLLASCRRELLLPDASSYNLSSSRPDPGRKSERTGWSRKLLIGFGVIALLLALLYFTRDFWPL